MLTHQIYINIVPWMKSDKWTETCQPGRQNKATGRPEFSRSSPGYGWHEASYFNKQHQVPSMDSTAPSLTTGLLNIIKIICLDLSCFNGRCEDDILINDPECLFGTGLFLICPLSLISNSRARTRVQSPKGTEGPRFISPQVRTLSAVVCTVGDKFNSFLRQGSHDTWK